jgi:D-glycero-D-manno-heptose 1,7-bisphosphate phosphatase
MKTKQKPKLTKAVFLDRDGVINETVYRPEKDISEPHHIDEFRIIPHVPEALQRLKAAGYKLIVISNQPSVAWGYTGEELLKEIDDVMLGLGIDGIYYCKHGPKEGCSCRKPKPGLIEQAAKDHNIDISQSHLVGDRLVDIQTGKGCKKTFLIGIPRNDLFNLMERLNAHPSHIVRDLDEASRMIVEMRS